MVSVCMITYNGEKYIKEQLVSILNQLDLEDEIIISDDGSSDNTLQIIESLDDSRIKVLHHTLGKISYEGEMLKCYRVGRNAENALKTAKGDYIFLADQDDVWMPDKVEKCITAMQSADLVLTNKVIIDGETKLIKKDLILIKPSVWRTFKNTPFLGCCMAFRKDLLNKILPFPNVPLMQDIWIGLMGLKYGKVALIEQPLLMYRRHGENVSIHGEKSKNPLSFKIMYRIYLLYAYLTR